MQRNLKLRNVGLILAVTILAGAQWMFATYSSWNYNTKDLEGTASIQARMDVLDSALQTFGITNAGTALYLTGKTVTGGTFLSPTVYTETSRTGTLHYATAYNGTSHTGTVNYATINYPTVANGTTTNQTLGGAYLATGPNASKNWTFEGTQLTLQDNGSVLGTNTFVFSRTYAAAYVTVSYAEAPVVDANVTNCYVTTLTPTASAAIAGESGKKVNVTVVGRVD